MGKRRNKAATASNIQNSNNLPSFNEDALSVLTAKIERGFEKGNKTSPQQLESADSKRKPIKVNDGPQSTGKATKKTSSLARGTKRDASGNAKPIPKEKPAKSKQNEAMKDDRAILLQEILALGGTEDDLDLVADASSEDEEKQQSSKATPDKSFRSDLARFVAGLGIEGHVADDAGESDVEREAENDEESDAEWEERSDAEYSAASVDAVEPEEEVAAPIVNGQSSKDHNRLIFEARPDWHAANLPALPTPEGDETSRDRETITNLKDYARTLLDADANLYASKHLSQSSSHRFLSTIMTSGTLSDKVSALTLVVQESPVHTIKSFESLLGLAKKRSRGQAVTALGALKDLLAVGVVLPSERRLRVFASQPGLIATLQERSISTWKTGQPLPGRIVKAHLISWAYEDWLKESYFEMLKLLEGWCNDEVEFARSRAVTFVYELLKEKPEQETNLLRLLVNKLGDPDKKIASRTSYLLLQLQISHPLMKPIIIRSIETELLLRPGQSLHAKYYAINTLNQTVLSSREEEVSKNLLSIYFDLFVSLLKKPETPKPVTGPIINRKGQIQGGGGQVGKKAKAKAADEEKAKLVGEETTEKMISAVLTGVNRAFPFSKTDDITLEKHMDTLFRITHSSNFNTSIQALMLIEQLASSKKVAVERFYRTLYESLFDPRLINSSKHALYLNLLFRALRADLDVKRVKAFAKRMLQVVSLHQPPFICGILYLLRELEISFPGLRSLLSQPEEDDEDGEEVFRDVPEEGASPDPSIQKPAIPSREFTYDGRKRDPEHSHADKSCLWESIPYLVHFHPSVSLFANRLVAGETMPPKPDLASHSLSNFLDRFVYRNAKAASSGPKGGSIMQPLSGGDSKGVLLSNRSARSGESVNTEAFWRKKAEDVAVDEVFFHKYFSQIGKSKQAAKKEKSKEHGSGAEDSDDEDEIWQALVESRPEVEGPSDDESDMEMLDLEDSDAEISAADSEDDASAMEVDGSEVAGSDEEGFEGIFSEGEDEAGSDLDELFNNELQRGQQQEDSGKDKGEETSRQKKRRVKSLPTFASVDDYAAMLDNDDGEDFGT